MPPFFISTNSGINKVCSTQNTNSHNIVLNTPQAPSISNTTQILKQLVKISDPQNTSKNNQATKNTKHNLSANHNHHHQQQLSSSKGSHTTSAVAKKLMQVYANQPLIPTSTTHIMQANANLQRNLIMSPSALSQNNARRSTSQQQNQPQLATQAYARLRADQIVATNHGSEPQYSSATQKPQSSIAQKLQKYRQVLDSQGGVSSKEIVGDHFSDQHSYAGSTNHVPVTSTAQLAIDQYNITPGAQMILSDTQTMIFEHHHQVKVKKSHNDAQSQQHSNVKTGKSGAPHNHNGERKKSFISQQRGGNQGNNQRNAMMTLSSVHVESSPYVSAETASIIKQQMRAQQLRVQHRANLSKGHTQSSGNLHAPKINSRIPSQQQVSTNKNLKRHTRRSSKGGKMALQAAGAYVFQSKDNPNGATMTNENRSNAKQGQITEMELSRQMSFKDADSFMAMASPIRNDKNADFGNQKTTLIEASRKGDNDERFDKQQQLQQLKQQYQE